MALKTSLSEPPAGTAATRSFTVAGQSLNAPALPGGLYLVATPIGNLRDITLRALETLAGADLVACEDTRTTRRLLERYGIKARLTPYHEHNASAARPGILEKLAQGAAIALVSDAGTPLISDPGFKLVRDVCAAGHAVIPLPGPSSVMAALAVAALPTDRFFFEGFLPAKEGARRARIKELAAIDATLVLFETGARIAAALHDLDAGLAGRDAAICREMTKLHEDIRRAPLAELAQTATALETRGEFVLVIGPPGADSGRMSMTELDATLRTALAQGSLKDAVASAAALSRHPRREVYARALELSKHRERPHADNDPAADDEDGGA